MKVSHFLLFLVALTGAAPDLVFKKHVFINTHMTWAGARNYCRENHVDLSIIDTQEEFNKFKSQITMYAGVRSWIGLSKKSTEPRYTRWCDGTMLNFTSWTLEPINKYDQNCITTVNNLWYDYGCEGGMPFFCYSEMIVVEEKKTWDEASQHCRTYYTDLISVTTPTDLVLVNDIRLNITTSFWTGLRFLNGLWLWVNKRPQGSLVSFPSCPNQPFLCGARKAGSDAWENRDCREKMYFACYRQGSE